jgi:hypothetical protein
MGVKVGVAVGMSVAVGEGVFVGASVCVGSGDGLRVAEGSGLSVFVESNKGASMVDVMVGSTLVGVLLTGRLQARMVRSKIKITEIRFMSPFYL